MRTATTCQVSLSSQVAVGDMGHLVYPAAEALSVYLNTDGQESLVKGKHVVGNVI